MMAGSSPAETPCVRTLGMFEYKGTINFESLRFWNMSDIHFLRLLKDSRLTSESLLLSEILFWTYISYEFLRFKSEILKMSEILEFQTFSKFQTFVWSSAEVWNSEEFLKIVHKATCSSASPRMGCHILKLPNAVTILFPLVSMWGARYWHRCCYILLFFITTQFMSVCDHTNCNYQWGAFVCHGI